ncbi:MAG TPA: glycoside hydrolase, partial [Verrucomicrobiae bacterium]
TDASYHTHEHFLTATGRGAGWHQFSGLSTPVLSWFAAYFKPGTATTGFEVMIQRQSFNQDQSHYEADLSFDDATAPHARAMLICLNPAHGYQASFDGMKLNVAPLHHGLIQVLLPASNARGHLVVDATP